MPALLSLPLRLSFILVILPEAVVVARWALVRVWHGGVLVPTVFHALVAGVEVYVALAVYGRAVHFVFLSAVEVLRRAAIVALLRQPLLTVVSAALFKAIVLAGLPLITRVVQVNLRGRLAPPASEIVEVLRVAVLPLVAVAQVLPVVRVPWVVLVVLHA